MAIWLVVAIVVGCLSPDLTKLAAEGQAKMVGSDAESRRAAELVKQAWPDEAYEAMAVAVLHRPDGLTAADRQYALRLSQRLEATERPREIVRVLGPTSIPEIAGRMVSHDGTMSLVAVSLSTSFVAPVTQDVVAWMNRQASSARTGCSRGTGAPLDRRRRDRPRLHGQRADLARPGRHRDGRPALDRASGRLSFVLAGTRAAGRRSESAC